MGNNKMINYINLLSNKVFKNQNSVLKHEKRSFSDVFNTTFNGYVIIINEFEILIEVQTRYRIINKINRSDDVSKDYDLLKFVIKRILVSSKLKIHEDIKDIKIINKSKNMIINSDLLNELAIDIPND